MQHVPPTVLPREKACQIYQNDGTAFESSYRVLIIYTQTPASVALRRFGRAPRIGRPADEVVARAAEEDGQPPK